MGLARMRTLAQAHKMLLENDPDTAVTKHALYVKMRSGDIPCVKVGKKRLINFDQLLEVLANPPIQPEPEPIGGIRRVK